MNRRFVLLGLVAVLLAAGSGAAIEDVVLDLEGAPVVKLYAPADALPEGTAPITPGPEKEGVTSSRWDDRDRNRIFDELDALIAAALPDQQLHAIVLFNERPSDEAFEALQAELGGFVIVSNHENFGDAQGRMWDIVPGFAAMLTKAQIHALADKPEVMHIEADTGVKAYLSTSTVEGGVDKAVTDFGVTGDRTGNNKVFTKDDIVICVIDTGIHATHIDLNEGQVIAWRDEVSGLTTAYDDNGHGTHVAGIAAGQGDTSANNRGVAYGAALVGVKVLNSAGSGTETDIVDGINWCNNNKTTYGIEIMTLSLGGGTCTSGNDAMSSAVNTAWNNGLVVTVAMGNDGPGYCTVGSPASAANIIAVGRVSDPKNAACTGYKAGGWYLGESSSRGATGDGRIKPDISAPGTCITAPYRTSTTATATLTGTSMSTPFVAGVIALMLDANPTMTPATVKSTLYSTSWDWGPDNQVGEPQSYDFGAGLLMAYDAVKSAGGFSGTGPAQPAHGFVAEDIAGTGLRDEYTLQVTSTSWRIAIGVIIPSASASKDFDIRLYNPSGTQVATSLTTLRQEVISYQPTVTGAYKIRVESYAGSGSYWMDTSAGASSLTLILDQ